MARQPTLYDAHGRPIRRRELTREIAAPTLAGVRTIWNETMASGLTPQRLARILTDAADGDHADYLTLAEEMEERNLHYACELGKRKLAVSRLPVTVESFSDDARDKKQADAVRAMVRRPGFRGLLKDLLDGLGKGYSVVEIIWHRASDQWRPARYEWRDPHFFQFDQVARRQIRLRDEADLVHGLEPAPYKFITHVPKIKSGIPIRGGIARLAAWAFMCSGYTIKDWLAFAEIYGMPLRLGRYRPGASEDDIAVLKRAVANLASDAAGVFPEGMSIEFEEVAKSSGSQEFFKILAEYLDAQVSKAILGQTATTSGTPGKLGNEEAQVEVRHDIRDDDGEQLAETLNRDLVRPFIDLNFGPQDNYPELQLRAIAPEDIEVLSRALERLVPMGLEVEASVVRDRMGLPDPADGAVVLRAAAAAAESDAAAANHARALNRQAAVPDEIDAAVEEALADWQPLMDPLVEPIRRALDEANDEEEFKKQLAKIFDDQDPARLTGHLATMLFKARMDGIADED